MNEGNAKKIRVMKETMSVIACFAAALIAAICIRMFVFELVRVDGNSMKPTLYDGQTLFVEKISLHTGNIQRGDIVIVHYPNRKGAFVKRVVGVAGDRIAVQGGALYVNGERQEESYTLEDTMRWDTEEVIVPEGYYYVMGDNRNDSMDSRSIGPISKDAFIGKAQFVLWPLGDIHSLYAGG